MKTIIVRVALVAVVTFALVLVYHGVTAENFSVAIEMASEDVNLIAKCPSEIGTIGSFFTRTKSEVTRLAIYKGWQTNDAVHLDVDTTDWPRRICDMGWPAALR